MKYRREVKKVEVEEEKAAHGFTRPTRRARSPYRARAPPTCTLTRNNAAIAPYQRVRRVILGRLPPKFVKVTASPAGHRQPHYGQAGPNQPHEWVEDDMLPIF